MVKSHPMNQNEPMAVPGPCDRHVTFTSSAICNSPRVMKWGRDVTSAASSASIEQSTGTRTRESYTETRRPLWKGDYAVLIGTNIPLLASAFGIAIVKMPFLKTALTFFSSTGMGRRMDRVKTP